MVQEQRLARPKSPLEDLPVEIIQEIFLRCLEINLPRASVHIARALSNPTIYTWLIRLAFNKIERKRKMPPIIRNFFTSRAFLPPQVQVKSLDTDERSELRTLILGCRWCTLPLIRQCQKEFIEHVLRSEFQDLKVHPEDLDLLANISTRFDNLKGYDKAPTGTRGSFDLALRAQPLHPKPSAPIPTYRIALWFNLGVVQLASGEQSNEWESHFELPFCEGSHLPDKLLCPPWTELKLEFLELLSTKAYIDVDRSYRRSTRALRQVIRDRDFATFERLLALYVRVEFYKFPVIWPVPNVVFRAALKHADKCDDPFVRFLVEERWDQIEPDDLRLKEKLLAKIRMDYYYT